VFQWDRYASGYQTGAYLLLNGGVGATKRGQVFIPFRRGGGGLGVWNGGGIRHRFGHRGRGSAGAAPLARRIIPSGAISAVIARGGVSGLPALARTQSLAAMIGESAPDPQPVMHGDVVPAAPGW
jgi:hypothetical protein